MLYMNTVNEFKTEEVERLFDFWNVSVSILCEPVTEILTPDLDELVRAKAAEAYSRTNVPIIVEHGSLRIRYLSGFPGPLSKPMWDLMGGKICKLVPAGESRVAVACSGVCYCDGKTRIYARAEVEGVVATEPRGSRQFQWDPIFVPNGSSRTYAEMDLDEKLAISQATRAYEALLAELRVRGLV